MIGMKTCFISRQFLKNPPKNLQQGEGLPQQGLPHFSSSGLSQGHVLRVLTWAHTEVQRRTARSSCREILVQKSDEQRKEAAGKSSSFSSTGNMDGNKKQNTSNSAAHMHTILAVNCRLQHSCHMKNSNAIKFSGIKSNSQTLMLYNSCFGQ